MSLWLTEVRNRHSAAFTGWMLLILLVAAGFRLHRLADIPPGLTHDEADHGITAWDIVGGERAIYFTVGYGREPLFDYSTALIMSALGPTFFAGRLTAVFFSLLTIAACVAWLRRAFTASTALISAAALAIAFWPVMAGRQSLRSITLPALFALGFYFFWRAVELAAVPAGAGRGSERARALRHGLAGGILLGLTFYTYIPARILWLLLPLTFGFVALVKRSWSVRAGGSLFVMLATAGLIGWPLFAYLLQFPAAEVRIGQLSQPALAAANGDLQPLLANISGSLRLFSVAGDSTWRYNIAGRPLLEPFLRPFFYLGLLLALWRIGRPGIDVMERTAHFAVVAWLLLGLAPVLVTGPELSMTQAIGMQLPVYVLVAVGLAATMRWLAGRKPATVRYRLAPALPLLALGPTALMTGRDYFYVWANHPAVRVQYETTLVAAVRYLEANEVEAAAMSTITPGLFHSQAVAGMVLRDPAPAIRWFDGRDSLVLPVESESLMLVPGFTPLSPALAPYLSEAELRATLPLRATDEDRPLHVFRLDGQALRAHWLAQTSLPPVAGGEGLSFEDVLTFLGYNLPAQVVSAGETVRLITLWQVQRPLPGARIFTHIQGPDRVPIAQADRLSVPANTWFAGDLFLQLHEIQLPADTSGGTYPIVVGACVETGLTCRRLAADRRVTAAVDELLQLTTLTVPE